MGVVSAADANRNFSALLRRVEGGEAVVITSHGRAVARMVPADAEAEAEADRARHQARRELLDWLAAQPIQIVEPWTREELYERSRDRAPGDA